MQINYRLSSGDLELNRKKYKFGGYYEYK